METDLEKTLTAALGTYPGIVSAYFFGSFAGDRAHAESDVDVAVLLDYREYPTDAARFEARVELASILEHELAPRLPDVVILNDATPTLAASIVTTGHRLLCNGAERDHAFRRDSQLRAADLAPFLRRTREVKRRAILRV